MSGPMTAGSTHKKQLWLRREQLLSKQMLQDGFGLGLIAVVAPAGYGKSVFARQLVESTPSSCITPLSAVDNDLVHLIDRWLAQLCATIPGFDLPELRAMLTQGAVKPTEYARFAQMLAAGFAAHGESLSLLFDDLHLITAPNVLGFIAELTRCASENTRFVVASRKCVVEALGVDASADLWVQITSDDLTFSKEEISELYEGVYDIPLTNKLVTSLDEKTDGWPMGLALLESSLHHHEQAALSLPVIKGGAASSDQLNQYFHSQLINHWPLQITQQFTRLALLDEIPIDLAQQLHTAFNLQQLLEHCPFVSASNNELRIHHLLIDCLRVLAQAELTTEQQNDVYRITADWYQAKGVPESALHYRLKAREFDQAYGSLRETGFSLVASNQLTLLRNLLDEFPQPWSDEQPWLWFFDGTIRVYTDPLGGLKNLLRAKDLLAHDSVDELIVLTSLIQYHTIFDSDFIQMKCYTERAEQLYLKVGQQLPSALKCLAAYNISAGFLFVHSAMDKVARFSDEALIIAEAMQLESMCVMIYTLRALAQGMVGNYPGVAKELERAMPLLRSPHVTAEAKVFLWMIRINYCTLCTLDHASYEREKQLANRQFPDGLQEKTLFAPWLCLFDAHTALAEGDLLTVKRSVERGLEFPVIGQQPHYRSILLQYTAIVSAIEQDHDASAAAAQQSIKLRTQVGSRFYTYQNQVTCATAALLRKDYAQAEALLDLALPDIRAVNDYQFIAAGQLVLALLNQQTGKPTAVWQPILTEGLSVMRSQGYLTLWNWAPELMRPALILAIENDLESAYAHKLLAERLGLTVSAKGEVIPLLQLHDLGGLSVSIDEQTIIEEQQLTAIQLQLLALLLSSPKHRLSYAEIYAALWSDDASDPRNRVDTVISRLRKTLTKALRTGSGHEKSNGADYLVTDKQMVRLQHCIADSQLFQRYGDQGIKHLSNHQPWQSETALERASKLWNGAFFQYIEIPDRAYHHQSHLAERFGVVACELAQLLIDSDQIERAIEITQRAFKAEPRDRDCACLLRDLYSRAGQSNKSRAVVQQFKVALRQDDYTEEEISEEMDAFFAYQD